MSESGVDLDFDLEAEALVAAGVNGSDGDLLLKPADAGTDELDRILASFDSSNIYEMKSQSAASSLRLGTEFSPSAMSMRTTMRQELMRQQLHQEMEKEDQQTVVIPASSSVGGSTSNSVSSSSFMHLLQGPSNPLLSASAPIAMEIPQPNKLSPVPELSSLPGDILRESYFFLPLHEKE